MSLSFSGLDKSSLASRGTSSALAMTAGLAQIPRTSEGLIQAGRGWRRTSQLLAWSTCGFQQKLHAKSKTIFHHPLENHGGDEKPFGGCRRSVRGSNCNKRGDNAPNGDEKTSHIFTLPSSKVQRNSQVSCSLSVGRIPIPTSSSRQLCKARAMSCKASKTKPWSGIGTHAA